MSAGWGNKVTVIVHHIPETEEYEGGYEVTTMTGVPGMVSVSASDRDSKDEVFARLLEGLKAFGFSGRVAVEDATVLGTPVRYEVEA